MNKNQYILNEFQEDYFDTYTTTTYANTQKVSIKPLKNKPIDYYTVPAEYSTYLKQLKNDF